VISLSSVKLLFKALEKNYGKNYYTGLNVERRKTNLVMESFEIIFTMCQNKLA